MARIVFFAAAATLCASLSVAQNNAPSTEVVNGILNDAATRVCANCKDYEADMDDLFADVEEDLAAELDRFSSAAKLKESLATEDAISRCRQLVNKAADSNVPSPNVQLPAAPASVQQILNRAIPAVRRARKQLEEKNKPVLSDAEKALKMEQDSLTQQKRFDEAKATEAIIKGLKDQVEARCKKLRNQSQPDSQPEGTQDGYATAIGKRGNHVTLKVGEKPFSNREYTWKTVPKELDGWFYEPAQATAKQDAKEVQVMHAGVIYAAFHPGNNQPFIDKGWQRVEIELSDSIHKYTVFKKKVLAKELVPVGNERSGTLVFFKRIVGG